MKAINTMNAEEYNKRLALAAKAVSRKIKLTNSMAEAAEHQAIECGSTDEALYFNSLQRVALILHDTLRDIQAHPEKYNK